MTLAIGRRDHVSAFRIAGCGLSGLAAGTCLAEAGAKVEILEPRTIVAPSSGQHSEGLRNYGSIDALEELRRFKFDLRPFATARLTIRRSPHHHSVLTGPAYYLFLRGSEPRSLDSYLFERAQAAGVRFKFGVRAPTSGVDIIATGTPPDCWDLLGVGFTFSREGSHLNQSTLYAYLDNEVAPGGYFAIAPGPTAHSLYSVSWGDRNPESLRRRVESALGLDWVREILGTSQRVSEILGGGHYEPNPIENAVAPSGALMVGEAGGFQDPIAGYGIRYAITTGALAARALLENLDYRRLLRQTFGNELEEAYAVRERLNHATNEDFDKLVHSMGPEMSIEEYRRFRAVRVI